MKVAATRARVGCLPSLRNFSRLRCYIGVANPFRVTEMRQPVALLLSAAVLLTLPAIGSAKGCLKGAAVGGVVGHVAGHHAVVGAAAGCVIEHHREKVKEKEERKNVKNEQGKSV
jgi:hypothetical protein